MNTPHIARTLRILTASLAAIVLSTGCGKNETASPLIEEVRALAVRTQPAALRTFERRLTVQGSLEAKNYANVASRADGNLDAIWVDEGDVVIAGKTALFQIDSANRQNALAIAEQDLAVAKASLAVARAAVQKSEAESHKATLDYDRYGRLHKDSRVTDNEFEAAEVQFESAKAGMAVSKAQVDLAESQVKQAESALSIANKNFDDAKVISPLSGVVSSRSAEPGEHMSVGHVLLRIDDLSTVEAAAYLPAQYYPEVIPRQTLFRLGVSGRDAGTHTVTYRSPTINTSLRTFEIKGRVEAKEGLTVPGNMADLTIVFESRQGLGIPSASILTRADKSIVFVVQDGKAVSREIQAGLQNDAWTEILSGLEAGEHVISEGQTQLRDGDPVEVR